MKKFLGVLFIVAGVVNLSRALRGFWSRPEYDGLTLDPISRELTKPRISRYMVPQSLLMIFVGVFILLIAAATRNAP